MRDLIIIRSKKGPHNILLGSDSKAVIRPNDEEKRVATYVIASLRINEPGQLTSIIGSGKEAKDADAIVAWIRKHKESLENPLSSEECYRAIKMKVYDFLGWDNFSG